MSTDRDQAVGGSTASGHGNGHFSVEDLGALDPQSIGNLSRIERDRVVNRSLAIDLADSGTDDGTAKIIQAKAKALENLGTERTRHLRAENDAAEQLKKIEVLKEGMKAIDTEQTISNLNEEIDKVGIPNYKNAMKDAKKEFIRDYASDWTASLTFASSFLVSFLSFGYLAYSVTKNGPSAFMYIMILFALVFAAGSSAGRKMVIFLTCKETLKPGTTAKNFAIGSTIVDGIFEIIGMPLLITQILGEDALAALGGWAGVAIMIIIIEVPCYIITRNKAKEALESPNIQAVRLREKIETVTKITNGFFKSLENRNSRINVLVDWALPQTKGA